MCDEIRLTLAEVRRRTPSAEPAWGPRGTTPRLTVRGTTAGAPPPPPPPLYLSRFLACQRVRARTSVHVRACGPVRTCVCAFAPRPPQRSVPARPVAPCREGLVHRPTCEGPANDGGGSSQQEDAGRWPLPPNVSHWLACHRTPPAATSTGAPPEDLEIGGPHIHFVRSNSHEASRAGAALQIVGCINSDDAVVQKSRRAVPEPLQGNSDFCCCSRAAALCTRSTHAPRLCRSAVPPQQIAATVPAPSAPQPTTPPSAPFSAALPAASPPLAAARFHPESRQRQTKRD